MAINDREASQASGLNLGGRVNIITPLQIVPAGWRAPSCRIGRLLLTVGNRILSLLDKFFANTRRPLLVNRLSRLNKGSVLLRSQVGHLNTSFLDSGEGFFQLGAGLLNLPLTGINSRLFQQLLIFRRELVPDTLADSEDQWVSHIVPAGQVLLPYLVNTCHIEYRQRVFLSVYRSGGQCRLGIRPAHLGRVGP